MNNLNFDTHKFVEDMVRAKMPKAQAEVLVNACGRQGFNRFGKYALCIKNSAVLVTCIVFYTSKWERSYAD